MLTLKVLFSVVPKVVQKWGKSQNHVTAFRNEVRNFQTIQKMSKFVNEYAQEVDVQLHSPSNKWQQTSYHRSTDLFCLSYPLLGLFLSNPDGWAHSPRFSLWKKKSIFQIFFFHFLQCKNFTPSARIDGTSDWHCTTIPAVPQIMSICVKGKAHTKIRSKVCTL